MSRFRQLFFREAHVCPWWLAYTFDNPARRLLHDPAQLFGPYLREGMTALDIGCGMGYFSIAMAKLVGDRGAVVAVDIQQKMLDVMLRRADSAGVARRIRPHLAADNDIGVAGPVDFALTFWMVHEVPDIPRFFAQVRRALKPGGALFLAEPMMHVPAQRFAEIVETAKNAGFRAEALPKVRFSRAALLRNGPA